MNVIVQIAQCIGFIVMAVGGIGLMGLIVYIAASEYFKFAVNRHGGFQALKRYLHHELKFLYWLNEQQEKEQGQAQ